MDEILTSRLRLRRARPDDLAAMHAVLSHPAAMRYWSTLPHSDLEQTRGWLAGMIHAPDDSLDFVVEYEGRVVGKAGMWRLPEIGFILHPDVWGLGLGHEAADAVVRAAFARPEVSELTADVDPRNAASRALLDRLGFVETGRAERTFLLGDEWCDSIFLALKRPPAP